MNWSDERYVKLYVRKTATWLTWPWQARAVFPSMLKEADGAGLIDVGTRDPVRTLSIMLAMPSEVVEPAVAAMLETGTLELTDRGYLITAYIEAQEATKTDSRRKQDQRERQRAQVRATTEARVTGGHAVSRAVPLQLSSPPAQPSPAQLTTSPPPDQRERPVKSTKKPKAQAELPEIIPPPPPRGPSRGEVMYQRFLAERAYHLREMGVEPVPPDAPASSVEINTTFARWFALWADLPPLKPEHLAELEITSAAEWRCLRLFELYFEQSKPGAYTEWDRARKLDTGVPQPWPFRSLASDKWWPHLVAAEWPDDAKAGAA